MRFLFGQSVVVHNLRYFVLGYSIWFIADLILFFGRKENISEVFVSWGSRFLVLDHRMKKRWITNDFICVRRSSNWLFSRNVLGHEHII